MTPKNPKRGDTTILLVTIKETVYIMQNTNTTSDFTFHPLPKHWQQI